MKSHFTKLILAACMLLGAGQCLAQNTWPKLIYTVGDVVIRIYKPQVDSLAGNILKCKSTISLSDKSSGAPVFGVVWTTDTVVIDRDKRVVRIESVKVDDLRMPADNGAFSNKRVKQVLEIEMPKMIKPLSLDELLASLDEDREETVLVDSNSVGQPNFFFRRWAAMLVPIYGDPIFRNNEEWGLEQVVNTPFTIVKAEDGKFYCYVSGKWYAAPAATGPYTYTDNKVGRPLKKIAKELDKAAQRTREPSDDDEATAKPQVYDVIVSTTPAEVIQSDGDPILLPLAGTALHYVSNSVNDIIVDTSSMPYYVLLSGRWYRSSTLNENSRWQYVPSDQLPKDFATIPNYSEMSEVLASIPGTKEAKTDAMDAQIPQVARIDRTHTTTQVVYDGEPRFEPIAGTELQYAVNSCSAVILYKGNYYAVDEGVWFFSDNPQGPWAVSIARPGQMNLIPRNCPVYSARFVHIYQVTADYVYDGYTAGYLNSDMGNCELVSGRGFGEDDDDDDFGYGWGLDGGFDVVWIGGGGVWGRGGGGGGGRSKFWRERRFRYERHRGYDGRLAFGGHRRPQDEVRLVESGRATTVTGGGLSRSGGRAAGGTRTPGGVGRSVGGGSHSGGSRPGGGYSGSGRSGGGYSGSGRSSGGGGSARSGGSRTGAASQSGARGPAGGGGSSGGGGGARSGGGGSSGGGGGGGAHSAPSGGGGGGGTHH